MVIVRYADAHFRFLAALRERIITPDKEKIAEIGFPHILSQLRHYYAGNQIFAIFVESNACPLWICSKSHLESNPLGSK